MKILRIVCGIFIITFLANCSSRKAEKPKEENSNQAIAMVAPEEEFKQKPLPPEKILSPLASIKELDQKIEAYKTAPNLTLLILKIKMGHAVS